MYLNPLAASLLPSSLARRTVQVELTPTLSIGVQEVADWSWWDEQSLDESANPYGAKLWPAAVAVAREIAQLPLEGKSVLELGCGNGLCSLAAAASGAASVLATDLSADALGLTADAAKAKWSSNSSCRSNHLLLPIGRIVQSPFCRPDQSRNIS